VTAAHSTQVTSNVNTILEKYLALTMPNHIFANFQVIQHIEISESPRCGKFSRIAREIHAFTIKKSMIFFFVHTLSFARLEQSLTLI
jgi:hypothetical protein